MAISSDNDNGFSSWDNGTYHDADLDIVSSLPWIFLNDLFEITCYQWSRNLRKTDFPNVYGSTGEGTASGLVFDSVIEDIDCITIYEHVNSSSLIEDTSECHAGFLQFKYSRMNQENEEQVVPDLKKELHNRSKSDTIKNIILKLMTGMLFPTFNNSWTTQLSGPATQRNLRLHDEDTLKSYDFVDAWLGLTPWPSEAEEWRTRSRLSGWPSTNQVEEVISQGYLVVPVAHPTSKHPESEWRFSFSEAEKKLIKSLNRWQKNCYIVVKLLCKKAFSGWKLLSTYHIKTIFLWMLEEYPSHLWGKDNIGQMSCLLLDKIILAFAKSNLPSYFIPSNNLIDHLSRDHITSCLRILRDIRRKPVSYLVLLASYPDNFEKKEAAEKLKELNAKSGNKDIKYRLARWCRLIAVCQGFVPHDAWFYYDTLTYRPLIEIILKMSDLLDEPGARFIEKLLLLLQDTMVESEAYQTNIIPDVCSVFCALASHFRVLYQKATDIAQRTFLYILTSMLFTLAIDFPLDYIVAEYAGFLFDACMYNEASNLLIKQCIETRGYTNAKCGYRHFIKGLGYLQISSKYYMLWIKFNLALVQGGPVDSIIQEYEDTLSKDQGIPMDPYTAELHKAQYGSLRVLVASGLLSGPYQHYFKRMMQKAERLFIYGKCQQKNELLQFMKAHISPSGRSRQQNKHPTSIKHQISSWIFTVCISCLILSLGVLLGSSNKHIHFWYDIVWIISLIMSLKICPESPRLRLISLFLLLWNMTAYH